MYFNLIGMDFYNLLSLVAVLIHCHKIFSLDITIPALAKEDTKQNHPYAP